MTKLSFIKTSQVYLIFTLSGASALVYQVLWSRWLGLVFGNTTTSISIVLGSFMLGLAVGSWAAGRLLPRINNPMKIYAFMELAIGIFACSFPLLSRLAEIVYTAVVSPETTAGISIFIRGTLALLLLLIPTSCMGATLPLLTDFFRRSPRHASGWKVGLLYAANTLGAALGIITASFFLIELLGVFATTMAAALLNFVIAFIGLRFASSNGLLPEKREVVVQKKTLDPKGKIAIAVFAASGAIALASEILWTRTLETLVGNSTYAFSSIVLLYLVGIAAGSWIMSLLVNRIRQTSWWLVGVQACMAIWILIAVFLFREIMHSILAYRGLSVTLSVMFWNFLKVMIILLPLSLLSGACFPLATRIVDPSSEDPEGILIAKAYAWNTAGAVVGSLLAGFVIAPLLDYFNALYLLAILYALIAFSAAVFINRTESGADRHWFAIAGFGSLSLFLAGAALFMMMGANDYMNGQNAKYPDYEFVYHKPGLQGVTTVIKKRKEPLASILLVNGMGMTVKITDTKMMAHLPMILHPDPEDALVICFGMGTTYRSAVSHGGRVTVVELVQEVFDTFNYFYEDAASIRDYRKGRMVVNDGRNFLKLTRDKYDVITLDPPPPIDAAGVNNLYSREFIELAKSRLKKGGIMAHWIPYPNTRSGVDDYETFYMLVRTFADAFPYVVIQRGVHNVGLHVLGSMDPIDLSMDRIKQRLLKKEVVEDMREWDPVPLLYFETITPYRSGMHASYSPITDDRPQLEFYLLRTIRNNGKKTFAYSYW